MSGLVHDPSLSGNLMMGPDGVVYEVSSGRPVTVGASSPADEATGAVTQRTGSAPVWPCFSYAQADGDPDIVHTCFSYAQGSEAPDIVHPCFSYRPERPGNVGSCFRY
jgi:hypothetical protein